MSGKFLTAEQIRQLDEIQADAAGAERTLRVALNFYANATNEIYKRRVSFWRELGEIHNLDDEREYTVRYASGQHEIVETEEKEGKP